MSETGADVDFGGEDDDLGGDEEADGEGAVSAFLVGAVPTELGDVGLGVASLEGIVFSLQI